MLSLKSTLLLAASATATIFYAGVAESGGEFGAYSATGVNGTGLPGRFNVDYAFLNASTVPIWVKQNKINTFRVAFLLERMCPLEYGLGARFNETYFSEFNDAIRAITSAGAYAILDPHNYMRYNDPSQQPGSGSIIGNTADPAAATTAQFQAFWHELASRYIFNPNVIFGIMNEPHDMPTELILANDQAAINGIRTAGAIQLIIAPGNGYTGGHSWNQSTCAGCTPNTQVMNKLKDPLGNTAIDVHEYLDSDFSGTHQPCVQSFPANMYGLTQWLKANNLKAMVTEFGGDNNNYTDSSMCVEYLTEAVKYMNSNPEYIGWTAWAAGPFWGSYSPCCEDYGSYGSLEPGSVASDGTPGMYYTVWKAIIQPLVPSALQRFGISSIYGGIEF
ncbi:glycoside hydrolase family 5 protein [Baudoinia panamericana UAMH 10762]|uniref:cellulase n=1 Tax=Baudoinia panamericana (strain UAMH 10762) TaxID=717646 RepID=M2MPQ0_BAUPA|nr:glycoside hydrolase family 5 protein [Baudoinia panamericana UAMH 10762]EMC98736.1 glycoside hydrolase family 5 protein [Baudoinia panamericana UAMH 10762]